MNKTKVGDKLVRSDPQMGGYFPNCARFHFQDKKPLTVKHVNHDYGNVSFREIEGRYNLYKFKPYEDHSIKQPHKHHDLIIAWAKGEEIQVLGSDGTTWYDVATGVPIWCNDSTYRVKPNNSNNNEIDQIEKELRKLSDRLNSLKEELTK